MTDNKDKINENIETEYDEEIEEIIRDEQESNRKPKRFMALRRRRKTIIPILIALLALGGLYYFNTHNAARNENIKTAEEIDQNSYNGSNIMRVDLNQVNKINIDLATADVRIQRSNTNPYVEYTHLYKGEEDIYTLDVSYENGELSLKSDIKGRELDMKNKVQIVRIFLPMDKGIDEIKGTIGAGDVKVTDLEVRNLDLNVKSGHISFENSFFGGSVANEVGDIILDKSELLNSKLSTNVGDVILTDTKIGTKSDFSSQSGDIIISSTDSIDNFNVKASLEVGNFVLGNISYRNIKDGFRKDNNAKKDINLKTKVGDIIFNKGEGAILEEEEYITNKSRRNEDKDSLEYREESDENEGESEYIEDQYGPVTDDISPEEESEEYQETDGNGI